MNMRQEKNTFFTTSLYKLDRLLEKKTEQVNELAPKDQQPRETELQ